MARWNSWLNGAEEEPEEQEEEVEEVEEQPEEQPQQPAPSYMTADQVQALLDNQAKQMQQMFGMFEQRLNPRQDDTIKMPSPQEMQEALDTGDSGRFLALQAQREAAIQQQYERRIHNLEQAGAQRFFEINQALVDTAVPEYKKYKKRVDEIMDNFGLQGDIRNNKELLKVLTNAARGENLEAELAAMQEARKRQANPPQDTGTGLGRRVPLSAGGTGEAPVFSDDAMLAMRLSGKNPDQWAAQMGYASWAEYEKSAGQLFVTDTETHKWLKKAKKKGR